MKTEPQCPQARGMRIVKQLIRGDKDETVLFEDYDDEDVYYGIGKQLGELVIDEILDAEDVHEIIHTHPYGDVVQDGFDGRKYAFGAEKSKQVRNDEYAVEEATSMIEMLFVDEEPARRGYDKQSNEHVGFDLAEQVVDGEMSIGDALAICEGYEHPDSAIDGFQRKVECVASLVGSVVGREYDELDTRVEFVRDQLFNQLFVDIDRDSVESGDIHSRLNSFKQAWDERFASSFNSPMDSHTAEDVPSTVSLRL
jgi:hypothetical protein